MSLLDHYWNLASDDSNERINAAEALLKGLVEQDNEKDWAYALRRLVRGLSSSRGSARLGFSMALAELLQLRAAKVSIEEYLELCDESFEISGKMKGNEERGLLFGQLFALKILAESNLWNKEPSNSADLVAYAERVVTLALRKAWLREPAFSALCGLVQTLGSRPEYEHALKATFQLVKEKGLGQSCEGVALALSVAREKRADLISANGWSSSDPMDRANLPLLSRVLREMPVCSGDVSESRPYIHFVWSYLLKEFREDLSASQREGHNNKSEPPTKKSKKNRSVSKATRVSLDEFWNSAVDRDFFGPETSTERKMWGFEIFLLWCQDPGLYAVAPLFSPNLIKNLAIHLAHKDRNLNKIAKKVAAHITQNVVKERPSEVVPIITQFMTHSPNFDKLSKSKVLQHLLSAVEDDHSVETLVRSLLDNIRGSSTEDLGSKQWIFDNLVYLVRMAQNRSLRAQNDAHHQSDCGKNSPSWVLEILECFIPLAYFVDKSKSVKINEEEQQRIAEMAQNRVMSILSSTLGVNSKAPKQDPQSSWPYVVVQMVLNFQRDHDELEPRVEFDEETMKAKAKAEHTLLKIHKKRNSSRHVDSSHLQAFELLFAMVLLQVYGSIPDAISMLDELQMCYYRINGKNRAYEEGELEGGDTDEDPGAVLTEILISLLSQQSSVLRKLSEDVWRSFSDQLSEGSLLLLCDILSAQEGVQGQNSLFDVENESDGDEEEDDGSDDGDEEVDSESDDDAADETAARHVETNEQDESDQDSGASSDYELDEDTKQKLAGALGVDRQKADNSESNTSESEEDSMDDEEMSALDVHLESIFRERRKAQTKAKEMRLENSKAKQNVVQLKGRVLDLLDIYYSAQQENLKGLICVEPLLNFIRTTKEARLAEKAREIVRVKLCRKCDYKLSTEAEIMQCLDLLQKVHLIAAESKVKICSLACNQVSVFLAKLVISFDAELISAVASIYNKSLQTWFTNSKNSSLPNLFIDFINFLDTKRSAA